MLFPSDQERLTEKENTVIRPFSINNSETRRGRRVMALVAMDKERGIGLNGTLPWRLREDMAHFKATTMGHPVIMGRRTWESLPKRPLPGRRNIVISRNYAYDAPGAEVFSGVEDAVAACEGAETPVIIGGAQIYSSAMHLITDLIVTRVDMVSEADTFFPELDSTQWSITEESEPMTSVDGITYSFVTYRRQ